MSMVGGLLDEFQHKLSEVVIIPSTKGVYDVRLGDELLYSKHETGRHAEYDEVADQVRAILG